MASPHVLLFPFFAQGHMIPMIDFAKLLAQRGVTVTLVTTPHNAARNSPVVSRATTSGLPLHIAQLPFPCEKAGLPEGCENLDLLPSFDSASKFMRATYLLYEPSLKLFEQLTPRPSCIISDLCLPWTLKLAQHFHVPRLVFYNLSSFFVLCSQTLAVQKFYLRSLPDDYLVTLPDLPGYDFQFRNSVLPKHTDEDFAAFTLEMDEADRKSYGVVFNTFEEMEGKNLAEFKKTRGLPDKVWCFGPALLCSDDQLDIAERGNRAVIDQDECVKWLNGQNPSSVIYVSLGSICNLVTAQLVELGLGLEASKRPFIWVIRKGKEAEELQKWLEEYDYKKKTEGRGLVISGWAPQLMILSHPATGCFLTHCGWNSTLEGVTAGLPLITWPLFADQFFNETHIVKMLKIGVSVGVEAASQWGEEEKGAAVKKEKVMEAIERVMGASEEGEEIRERCRALGKKAIEAVKEGGSSYRSTTLLIEDIIALGGGGEGKGIVGHV
ncbi:UDP-glycosyltransferase 73C1-like [Cucurbita maxima]|uniref:Glycosyltransferase n=1 Tax=Cucurbita maxima TaxID=3661 RepID=A0A6J1IXW5_CUCMA|nr:UDP-glycosyltransferase 73C1-like [Cucurbita maxima]